jgi:arylsulfatase
MDLSDDAYTINRQGLTLVPLDIKMVNGDVEVTAIDEHYRYPGSEENQKF